MIYPTPTDVAMRRRQYRDINRESQELSRYIAASCTRHPHPSQARPAALTQSGLGRKALPLRGHNAGAQAGWGRLSRDRRSALSPDRRSTASGIGVRDRLRPDERIRPDDRPEPTGPPAHRSPTEGWDADHPHREDSRRTDSTAPLGFGEPARSLAGETEGVGLPLPCFVHRGRPTSSRKRRRAGYLGTPARRPRYSPSPTRVSSERRMTSHLARARPR